MACMRDIRRRSEHTDAMFEPLRETVEQLARCGMPIAAGDPVLLQLEQGPLAWKGLKRKMQLR